MDNAPRFPRCTTGIDADVQPIRYQIFQLRDDIRILVVVDRLDSGFLGRKLESVRNSVNIDYAVGTFEEHPFGSALAYGSHSLIMIRKNEIQTRWQSSGPLLVRGTKDEWGLVFRNQRLTQIPTTSPALTPVLTIV